MYCDKVAAAVLGSLNNGKLSLIVRPIAEVKTDRTRDWTIEVPLELVPFDLRFPNTLLWIDYDDMESRLKRVWKRDSSEPIE